MANAHFGVAPRDASVRQLIAVAADANGGVAPIPNYKDQLDLNTMLGQEKKRAAKYIDGVYNFDSMKVVPIDERTIGFKGEGPFSTARPLTARAEYHLAVKTKVPSGFFSKSSAKLKMQILAEHGGALAGKEMFLRLDENGNLRAALSSRYAILDNAEVIDATIKLLKGHGGVAAYLNISDTFMHGRILFPEFESVTDPQGSKLHIGVQLRNSEVGMSSLVWEPVIFRVDCWNGIIIAVPNGYKLGGNNDEEPNDEPRMLKARHSGDASKELFLGLEAALADIVRTAPKHLQRVERATMVPAGEDYLERITDKYDLPKGFDAQVAALVTHASTATVWDYVNAVTAAAQSRTLDQRIAIERAAGKMLANTRN